MKKFLIVFLFIFIPLSVNADDNINKVFKLESYKYDEFSDSFKLIQYWSAVYINKWLIYTNAHVVLDYDDKPIWNYKVCKTINFKNKPKCFTVWKLLYYDTKKDLAILQIWDPGVKTVKFSNKKLDIWDVVKVYWYPSNWWETITYTEWKISGYEKGLYKIDANIDSWNSWWWVFDSDWNLIWIAVSVRVWYTTLWYIIPVSDIKDFQQRKDKSNIEIYNKKTDPKFVFHIVLLRKIIWATKFNNFYIKIDSFRKYGYIIDDYNIDSNKEFFQLILKDKKNNQNIYISNFVFYWDRKVSLDYILEKSKEQFKTTLALNKEYKYKWKKIKIWNKKAILEIFTDKKDFLSIGFTIEVSKNNFQRIYIFWEEINKKAINNALRIILKKISFNKKTILKDDLKLYNLKLAKNEYFTMLKDIEWEELAYIWDDNDIDIEVNFDVNNKIDTEDYTLSSYLQYTYSFLKDYWYYNFIWIKETKSWEKYFYFFMLNNKTKWWQENKKIKKYWIIAFFLEEKDDKNVYSTNLVFTFDKVESKKIIDDFIDNIKTQSGVTPYEVWELKVWENLVEEEEFEFKE